MVYLFGGYELDTQLFELRRKSKPCHLEPQVFNLLVYLVQNRERVVAKDELLEEVWGTQFITEATLSSRLMAARKAIGDDGQAQRFIKTVRGRGFRFVGEVEERVKPQDTAAIASGTVVVDAARVLPSAEQLQGLSPASTVDPPFGREVELDLLQRYFARAQDGARQFVFVTGESGIGKTTLVNVFLRTIGSSGPARIACGQCLEQHGRSEAYLPLLDALARLCRQPEGGGAVEFLKRCAPTWLVQMPWLLSAGELQELEPIVRGATSDRMLREMVQTLEAMTQSRPLVLVLEDLQWSDLPTLQLISWLARRTEPARLLMLATYRPADVTLEHPLRTTVQELRIRGHSAELALPFLNESAVQDFLGARFPKLDFPTAIAGILHERTGGNPLFMQNVVDAWLARNLLRKSKSGWELHASLEELAGHVPDDLRQLIEQQLSQLEPNQQEMLESGSVAGMEFTAATIADETGVMAEYSEEALILLARQGRFIQEHGLADWPSGTVGTQFAFTHHLYQQVLYERIAPTRRARLHVAVASRLEAAYGVRAPEIASRLADHFVRGRDPRAVHYLQLAAQQLLKRSAYHEALEKYSQALALLQRQPQSREREYLEMELQNALASALIATEGWGSPGAAQAFERTCHLAQQLGEATHFATAAYGHASLLEFRGEFVASQKLMEERLKLLRGLQSELLHAEPFVETHDLLACSFFHQGAFAPAVQHADLALESYDPNRHNEAVASAGENLGVASHYWAALSLWYLGYPDTASERIRQSLALAQAPDRAYCLASALTQSAMLHQLRREPDRVLAHAQASIDLAQEKGFPYRIGTGMIFRGWVVATSNQCANGISQIHEGLELCHQAGVILDDPYYLALLVEAYAANGQAEQALSTVDQALQLVGSDRPFFHEAELHRLKGRLLWQSGDKSESETSFKKAHAVACQQNARSLELRIAVDLHNLRPTPSTRRAVQKYLDWFEEKRDAGEQIARCSSKASQLLP